MLQFWASAVNGTLMRVFAYKESRFKVKVRLSDSVVNHPGAPAPNLHREKVDAGGRRRYRLM